MSVHVMSWVLRHSEEKLGRRLVLLVLADHAKEDGTCAWPAVDTIAHEARMSHSQVSRCLRDMKRDGSIVETGTTRQGVKIYSVVMEKGAHIAPPEGAHPAARGGASTTSGGVILRPEPSLEQPSKETSVNPLVVVAPAREVSHSWKVDRKIVSVQEAVLAESVLVFWNQETGHALRSKDWLAKIVMRAREYPEMTEADHCYLIRHALAHPWWKGPPTPSVVYGSSAQFERSITAARSNGNGNGYAGALAVAEAALAEIQKGAAL